MSNVLLESLPIQLEVEGKLYDINTDFRVALRIMSAFEDCELTDLEKQLVMLKLLYNRIPQNKYKAAEQAIWFLNCGEDPDVSGGSSERLYSFEKDAKYIYSAIMQTHGVDLADIDYLHWWKFCYMFFDLCEDCFFTKIVYYRNQRNRGKLTKEEREYCSRIKHILDLPQPRTQEEIMMKNAFLVALGEK